MLPGLSAEEQAELDAAEAEKAASKKKKKDKKKAKKKGKKGDKEEKAQVLKIGPTEVVLKFEEMYSEYADAWATRDEKKNIEQSYDNQLAREEVLPAV